ncbi:autotransporter outer membrane beta-barrel domain-containing protein [Pseudomonas capeferrum]|uniref:autotransporter outer membrane beta-barrel domain-containing protein n=1 Tax=Pseudomonas capeferrum TaxID=1495066 RepID=UPI0015E2FB8B|nr:autotransporter outer membrane beta-barrel domain-containing protein [Pseudomonas capeferrum]MBA1205053.1 autotransporter outer membrane beta-barrel domain-containing protein [Pseudomonas capeferrum]
MAAFSLSPLPRALRAASLAPMLLLSPVSLAQTIDKDTTIDGNTALDNYFVANAATLTANGAITRDITLNAGTALVLTGSQVNAIGPAPGVRVTSATASIDGSVVTAQQRGLIIGFSQNDPNLAASMVDVNNSVISGGIAGAQINNSRLTLAGSQLLGSNANGVGADMFDGDLQASAGSRIVGGQNGVRFRGNSGQPDKVGTLLLDASHVEGLAGSAIAVGTVGTAPVSANIDIRNGSTLKASDGTLVEIGAAGTSDIKVNASDLLGDIIVAEGGTAKLTLENQATFKGRLENLDRLALNSGGQWTLVGDAQLNELAMDGGSVAFGDQGEFYTLQVNNLAGNGIFVMNTDLADGQSDFLEVTGTATGNHQILVTSTGKDPLNDTELHLVHTAAGDASFSLQGGPVDLGTYAYGLVQRGNDWYLDAALRTLTPSTQTALALFNTAPTVWYGELTTLRSRMGEVRRNGGAAGGWMRSYGNQFNASTSGFGYKQQQQGLSFGADGRLPVGDGNWLVGVTAGYSNSDLNLQGGSSGRVDSYHIGAYTTWLDPQSGYYFDGVAKLNRYQNSADVQLSDGTRTKGDYSNNGVGLSLEVGRHLKLNDGYFIEPYAQLAAMTIEGQSYHLDNGLQASGDHTRSLQGKLGTTVGRTFDHGDGRMIQPYVRVAAAHEFANNNRVRINGNGFDNNLAGSRGELGAGVVVAWAQQWQAHAEFDYANGEQLEQPWGASVGVRYNW